mgnify:CR=1 FL=1
MRCCGVLVCWAGEGEGRFSFAMIHEYRYADFLESYMERINLLFLKLNVDILRECLLSAHGTYWDTTVLVLF